MRIGDTHSFVEFEFKEAVPEHLPGGTDTACSVRVSCDGFSGKVERVWFERDDINRFLSELQVFEEQRKGSVSLKNSSSPSDFSPLRFEIFSIDHSGHLAVRTELLKTSYVGDDLRPLSVSVSFSFDSGMLRSVVEDFRKLFKATQGPI